MKRRRVTKAELLKKYLQWKAEEIELMEVVFALASYLGEP